MKRVAYCVFETSLGPCGIAWREAESRSRPPAVIRFQLPEATEKLTEARLARYFEVGNAAEPPRLIADLIEKVRKHLSGDAQDFRQVAVDFEGAGPFAREVYETARQIPIGQTRSYGELAEIMGRPKAARAVGQALGKNPVALIIPCHRILGAGGKPGGFSAYGGRSTKATMLAIEGVTFDRPASLPLEKEFRRAAARLKARDPRLALCMAKPIGWKLKPEQSPYATLFEAIIHQQLAVKAAQTILGRVKDLYPGSSIPEPSVLLKTVDESLRAAGVSRSKTMALKDLAAKTLDGTVPTAQEITTLGDAEIIQRLSSIHGVGRWTAEMMLIFNLGRLDILPVDDYALRKIIGEVYEMPATPSPKEVTALGENWRPHRTVATLYLWNFIRSKEVKEQIAPLPTETAAKPKKRRT